MAKADEFTSEAQTRGVGAPTGRVRIHASDRALEIAAHDDQKVLTLIHDITGLVRTEMHVTYQELADALATIGAKLPKGRTDAEKS